MYNEFVAFMRNEMINIDGQNIYPIISKISGDNIEVVNYSGNNLTFTTEGNTDKKYKKFVSTIKKYSYVCRVCGETIYPKIEDISFDKFSILYEENTMYKSYKRDADKVTVCRNCITDSPDDVIKKLKYNPDQNALFSENKLVKVSFGNTKTSVQTTKYPAQLYFSIQMIAKNMLS